MRSILALALLFFAACTDGTQAGAPEAPQQHLPRPFAPTFTLFVSNQSFDLPQVDIAVELDGQLAVSGDFLVEGQHTWIQFDFDLAPGSHQLRVKSEDAGVTLDEAFDMDARKWGVVNFWYHKAGSPEPTPEQFSFDLFDEAPQFE
ncbi:MAG TPA: hypothetical protein VK932_18000 [Kofleriaceae bacterium]|nr:hypothetical protein [Kofleriaceae bacterium]